jgi:hypothetical protein
MVKRKQTTRVMPFPLRLEPQLRKHLEELAAAERRSLTNFLMKVIQDRVGGGLEAGSQYHYTRQKLWEAVNVLVGDGSMAARLGYAQGYLLVLRPEQDFPESMREKFATLMDTLRRHSVTSRTEPTRINLKHPESDRAAETILGMYVELKGGL